MTTETAPHYVVVQAGGKGTRLEQYSWNKPKCLVPIEGRPLIYHTFSAFPSSKFVIIVDYKADIVKRFLGVFRPDVDFTVVQATGASGTLSGISDALEHVPDGVAMMLVWCDLNFTAPPKLPALAAAVVGATASFPCRWSFGPEGQLIERRSDTAGVIGLFGFPDKTWLAQAPRQGEFVAWLASCDRPVHRFDIDEVREIGTVEALTRQWSAAGHARFFNKVEMHADHVVKTARLPEFQGLIDGEIAWYRRARELGFANMPDLLAERPLTLSRIHGQHPFDFASNFRGKADVLERVMRKLSELHALASAPARPEIVREVYYRKTLDRLVNVQRLLPELTALDSFRVNGTLCRNILHERHAPFLRDLMDSLDPGEFNFAHGDPTFSNILVTPEGEPYFIDPRGKFGSSPFLGDADYDWSKLYYSVVGEYDNFNRRQFLLELTDTTAEIQIRSGGWAHLKGAFREYCGPRMRKIEIIHGLIWLALSGYVDDDYDSIVAAFLNGLFVLEEAVSR